MLEEYQPVFLGLWLILATIIVQAMVAIRVHRRQKGGYNVGVIKPELGQSSIVFRSHRTFQNSLENITPLMGMAIIAALSGYSSSKLTVVVWVYAIARIVHMVLYYKIATDKNPSPRSIFWAIGFLTNLYLMIDLGVHLIL
jgi:uncharacterized MAPEG superfamily protein